VVVDRYTKGVLTVIAGCLLFQCLMAAGKVVDAQPLAAPQATRLPGQAQPVVIVGWGEMSMQGEIALNTRRTPTGVTVTDTTLQVRLPYTKEAPLPVAIDPSQPLPIVMPSALRLVYSPDHPLPVAINGSRNASREWDPINVNVTSQAMGATPGPAKP
jgi:hypothetical protein